MMPWQNAQANARRKNGLWRVRILRANLLEARQSDWKDEAVLVILTFANFGDRLGGLFGRSGCDQKR